MDSASKVTIDILDKLADMFQDKFKSIDVKQLNSLAKGFSYVVSNEEFMARDVVDLYGMIVSHWQLIRRRADKEILVRVYNPEYEKNGWNSKHTVVEVAINNVPFAVDTLLILMSSLDKGIHFIANTGEISVNRDSSGLLQSLEISKKKYSNSDETLIIMEIDRQDDDIESLECIEKKIVNIYNKLQVTVEDFDSIKTSLDSFMGKENKKEIYNSDDIECLEYLKRDNFIFLGMANIDVNELKANNLSYSNQLGLLRFDGEFDVYDKCVYSYHLNESNQKVAVYRSAYVSPIHRSTQLDIILVNKYNDKGEHVSIHAFIGLFTYNVSKTDATQIPFSRSIVNQILEKSQFRPKGHSYNSLLNIIETLPRVELFTSDFTKLYDIVMGIFHIRERQVLKLFINRDQLSRYAYCMVYIPRDRYNSVVREKINDILINALNAKTSTFKTYFFESVLCRIDFKIYMDHDKKMPDIIDIDSLEKDLAEAEKNWSDNLLLSLIQSFGENKGRNYFTCYKNSFTPAYQHNYIPRQAVVDIGHFEKINATNNLSISFYKLLEEDADRMRLKIYLKNSSIELSYVLPILENLGMCVLEEKPFIIEYGKSSSIWLSDFGLRLKDKINLDKISPLLEDIIDNVWTGVAENDRLNKLVISSELNWHQISIVRALSKYLLQIGLGFSKNYIEDTFLEHGNIIKILISFFDKKCNPLFSESDRKSSLENTEKEFQEHIFHVTSLVQDKILRKTYEIIKAIVRTNFYQLDSDGNHKAYISLKLKPALISEMPKPVPMFETFVYSPRFEGIHLRGSKVARGGLRWSDRYEDYRTEVLGLVKAQQVKNAVIVPQGAKGGFVPKQIALKTSRKEIVDEGIACYKLFISALLDLADNIKNGEIIKPIDTVCYDDDDSYIVVAADKGTSTFSDIANEVAANYDFWLGDAFASGGSNGYDHKKMGITARGAWESVKRHFKDMSNTDIQKEEFTVVGIGDMAGDVFGNGMLLSKHIRLIAAFNHMHIFIDPNPNADTSYKERKRMFELSGSSWLDYNQDLISRGGGIFDRSAKKIILTNEMKELFETTADKLEPIQLIKLILTANVDLLWNGGIGTYVKSNMESSEQVGDRSNDNLRVNGKDLRCKVVGEGGNLGFTQLGRIEYAQRGGKINTDAIDNSAGVDCSDHEVNIKILLNEAVAGRGKLTPDARNELLASMSDEVATLVLKNNIAQTKAISLAVYEQSSYSLEAYSRLMRSLEKNVQLDREVEFLPTDHELEQRKNLQKGLTAPEFSVVMAYTKIMLKDKILKSSLPEEKYFIPYLRSEFPAILYKKYSEEMLNHKLVKEIVATQLTNMLIMHTGITFIQRVYDETGASIEYIIKAFSAVISIFDVEKTWLEISKYENIIGPKVEQKVLDIIFKFVRRTVRWIITHEDLSVPIEEIISKYKTKIEPAYKVLDGLLIEEDHQRLSNYTKYFIEQGLPESLAYCVTRHKVLKSILDLIVCLDKCDNKNKYVSLAKIINKNFLISWFRYNINRLSSETYWSSLAVSALRDELDYVQYMLVNIIISQSDNKLSEQEMFDCWADKNKAKISYWHDILQEMKGSKPKYESITIAFKALKNIIKNDL